MIGEDAERGRRLAEPVGEEADGRADPERLRPGALRPRLVERDREGRDARAREVVAVVVEVPDLLRAAARPVERVEAEEPEPGACDRAASSLLADIPVGAKA